MTAAEKYIARTHSLQLEQRDCGVACLLNLIQYYGGNSTIDELRRQSGTTITGTTLLGLKQAAEQTGFTAEGCEADIPALLEHGQPVILHVIIEGNLQHYMVFYEKDLKNGSDTFILGDPAKGIIKLNAVELEKIWVSKACLTLTPNENFIKKEAEKNASKNGF